ncbi:TIGR02921 family PEP-CTERM protein [Phormidium pseudopriestleyi FRX01]|uniref:TIGR02921 family PEP-CTERM protein n=1 Tax=Phormidium pseudopriestleyi FRX01 TaxID=1759528 RepID=A0ABS3FTR0_9CYAN|nr:TIGR02921 family PEP-CTERM protein [Phormidium pseudopriestleyi]MBO0350521.1 TIGR02921 family PEP-CTERM protein [Phormidium pseudopriestleyi FRX01]
MKVWLHGLFSLIFWLWNLTFLGIVYLGILPWVAIPLIRATAEGIIPLEFTLAVTGAIAIPTVCTVIGIKLRKHPLQLIRLFYGVEAPLFTLCLVRLFMLREMTPASNLMVGTALLAMAAFALELFYGYAKGDRKLAWLQLATHSLMLLMGLYLGTLLLFYVVPFTVFFAGYLISLDWVEVFINIFQYNSWNFLWWAPFSFFLWGFSATLFIAMPSALATFYIYSGYKIIQKFAAQYGRKWAIFGSGVVVTAWMVLFFAFQQQPQIQAFKTLENPASTDRERQELLAKSDSIRQGLLNAYLLSYRYLSTHQDNNHIRAMYRELLGIEESAAQVLQNWYNGLMSPFLYQGSREDIEKAATLYQQFFDTPIQKGEAKTILHAVQSTFNQEEAKAGLLNINEQRVLLTQQEITVTERGDWADVELYEVYENQTPRNEEVFYYFSLPESAVLTGVWLNETADRSDRYVFQISPRGAAQQVYNAQVQRNIDPALLEQVGPRQYRLRVFPIPARLTSFDNPNRQEQPKQHLWLTYKVMQTPQGWAMPQLAEKRNVFWNRTTQRQYNGEPVKRLGDAWMPEFLPATNLSSGTAHKLTFPGDYQISAQPLRESDYILPQGKRIAVIVDRSYSMRSHGKEVTETLNWLKRNGFADNRLENNDADLYLTASPGAMPVRLDNIGELNPAQITYYGSLNYREILQQFQELQGDTSYDAVALISDRGSYELAKDSPDLLTLSSPLWMVHLGGLPRAYDDGTLQAIQGSGGGVSTELEEVLQRIATTAKLGPSTVSVVDGYRWFGEKPAKASLSTLPQKLASATVPDKAGLEPLGARQLILALSKQMDATSIADLDAIHAIAKHYEIVSPYSSAIVLVNEEQKRQLKEAESSSDRFEREIEDGTEELQQPEDLMSVPVPEPHQWVGMIAATGLLIFAKRKWGKKSVG